VIITSTAVITWRSKTVNEWLEPPLAQDRTIGPAEGWIEATIGLFIAVGLVLFVVGTSSLFVAGSIYLNSLTELAHLPFLGQFFGP
jgi:hypothetical protein